MEPGFYFMAPKNYFWKWADNTEVIEWRFGATICYRDELIYVLKEFTGEGFPPLETILLVLAACNKGIPPEELRELREKLINFHDPVLEKIFLGALQFLHLIHQLPPELRTGERRIHLLQELFKRNNFVLSNGLLNDGLEQLRSGQLDEMIVKEGEKITKEQFQAQLEYLSDGLKKFPTQEQLELYLRTGLTEIPAPAPIELPQPLQGDLFTELEHDQETLGIARLARRISSVITIPMHSQGSGDRSHGGLSDITNRGNYDRLLLSELAHDDLHLMARLVNNEALYFRREEPPDNPKRKRTILLDGTLKMWGVPRVFALSAALAFAHNSKHGEIVEAYTLGGEEYAQVNLGTKQGIVASLEQMHHALHCGKALHTLLHDLPDEELNEYTLITEANLLRSAIFHEWLTKTREALSFIITVNRTGELQFYECTRGKLKLLNTARLDLEELLFAPGDLVPVKREQSKGEPAFFSYMPSPLLYPKVRISQDKSRKFQMLGKGLLVINESQRVLFISHPGKGALELLSYIEKGKYIFGWDGVNTVFILVVNYQRDLVKVYSANVDSGSVIKNDLDENIQAFKEGVFKDNKFYIQADLASLEFDCKSMTITGRQNWKGYADVFGRVPVEQEIPVLPPVRYSVMYRIRDMYIDEAGNLVLGNYTLILWQSQDIWLKENFLKKQAICRSEETNNRLQYFRNQNIKFIERTWPDGSKAIIDSRGFLHLKSIDPEIPEISLLLVTAAKIACWTPGRTVCGSDYFINDALSPTIISAGSFYESYIKKYINRILKGCK